MDRSAPRIRDIARLGLVGAIALLLALSRASVAHAGSDLVLICHATGSESNEIVIIRVDASGMNGHDLEEIAKTYDCQPAGGSGGDGGGSIDSTGGGSGSGSGGTSGGGSTGGSSAPAPGTSPTAGPGAIASPGIESPGGSSAGSTGGSGGGGSNGGSGSSSPRGPSGDPAEPRVMIIGAAGIGPAGAEASIPPDSLTFAAGAVRAALPMTDTVARFLAHSSTGQRLGVGLTAIAGLGFLLLVVFGSLARRRA